MRKKTPFQSPFEVSDVLRIQMKIGVDGILFQSPFEVSDVLSNYEVIRTMVGGFNPLSRFLTY